ncbi:lysylphosphatidylglycerol synthase transmembrane domain-containing protein [Flavobacterium sp.]|uniref:lysylphosphatidylglycerol synthase transmembrane domain-containing protein n=1 Tax=Flavobacterium sp. TaxID=239 RepID=UPI001B77166C|nr:lysylphosphatidylglycerol synthase transmembrane domain-containing protein [Flavobacterium sp.]MBP6128654.1 flippase-like domain-containing protein [Flavobacterium sp.]
MRTKVSKIASVFIPLLLGFGLIYYQYTTLSVEELNKIKFCFQKANYFYIFLSLLVALFGYWARAYRWKYSLQHLGYQTNFKNDLMSVCVSYFMNLTIPRSGEITRAALLKKYENVPFDKGFGTIVAERIVDLILFLLFVGLAFILQFEKLYNFIKEKISIEKIILFGIIGLFLGIVFLLIWIYAEWKIIKKLKNKFSGLIEGMLSIVMMKDKWKYIFFSFLIWFSYLLMFYIPIYALPETANIGFDIVIMGFIFGSLAVGFTNGGLGAYPLAIAMIFSLYGISNDIGTAFGWLAWTSQTILTIFLGLLSYVFLPLYNKNK